MVAQEIKNDLAYLLTSVEEPKEKLWLKTALITHLVRTFKHKEQAAKECVEAFYTEE